MTTIRNHLGSPRLQSWEGVTRKVFGQLTIISDKDLKPYLPAASSLIKDPKDWLYLTCALREDTIIWSDYNDFSQQKRIKVFTTKELVGIVGSL